MPAAGVLPDSRLVSRHRRSTPPGVFISSARHRRARRRRARIGLLVAALLGALAAVALGSLWLAERNVLPARTEVAGVEVGGRTLTEARLLVTTAAQERLREPVVLSSDDYSVEVTGAQVGASPLVDEAIAGADGVGFFGRLARRVGIGETRAVPLRYTLPRAQVRRLAAELDRRLAVEPRDARLVIRGTTATVRPSRDGRSVAIARLTTRLRTLPATLDVPLATVEPEVTTARAERARRLANELLGQPRRVTLGDVSVALPPALLARAIRTAPGDGGFGLRLDPEVLRTRLAPTFSALERDPTDAGFRVDGARVRVTPARPGRQLDVDRIAQSLLANLDSTSHRARFVAIPPTLTTAQAEKLEITELVSEFTTYYPCCAPRVTNIQRAATLLDGTVLPPGGTFSLNDALGQRTVDKGFVAAPQIRAGRLEDAVGGGISQVATTLYNAAFFAGLRLDAHQPHEFYISRYPMGREATVSWRSPELIFTNDWPAGLLIKVSASDTAITVRFYSTTLGRRVETTTGEPYATTAPRTFTSKNPSLRPGEKEVVQEPGAGGFSVRYTRKVWRNAKLKRDEVFTVRYKPQNGYVEVGPPKKPAKKPKPGTKAPTKPVAPGDEGTTVTDGTTVPA